MIAHKKEGGTKTKRGVEKMQYRVSFVRQFLFILNEKPGISSNGF